MGAITAPFLYNCFMKKILLVILLVLCNIFPVYAEGDEEETPEETAPPIVVTEGAPAINAPSAIVMESTSGTILYQKDMHAWWHPNGCTKLITAYLGVSELGLDDTIVCSMDAIFNFDRNNNKHIWLTQDEKVKVADVIYASLLENANDAARVLAEGVGGSQEGCVEKLNNYATSNKLEDTWFTNTTGIFDAEQHTSAYDLAMMTCVALTNPTFREVYTTNSYSMAPTNLQPSYRHFNTSMALLKEGEYKYEGTQGGKIGYSQESGYNLVATAERDNLSLTVVLMGEEKSEDAYQDAITLYNWCFEKYQAYRINRSDVEPKEVEYKVKGKKAATVTFSLNQDINVLLKSSDSTENITTKIVVKNEDDLDKMEGQLEIYKDDAMIGMMSLNKSVEQYDISFNATTRPLIDLALDLLSIAVLAVFLLAPVVKVVSDHLSEPE